MAKDKKQLRKELVDSLLNLLEESNNEVLDYSYETDDEWAFIETDGVSGWVNLNYLQLKEKGEAPKHSAGKYTIGTNDDPLGIRVKPHSDAQRNGEVPKGQEVEVLTVCGDWGYVEYGEYSGWLSFQYLK